jgi:hypothetical protein
LADAEMLERALGLRTSQLVRGDFNHAKAVGLFSHAVHCSLLSSASLCTSGSIDVYKDAQSAKVNLLDDGVADTLVSVKPTKGHRCASQQKLAADVALGQKRRS